MSELQMDLPEVEASGVVVEAVQRRRGRPSTGCAMSAAERMRNMRARRKAQGKLFSQVQPVTEISVTPAVVSQARAVNRVVKVRGYLVRAVERFRDCRHGDRHQRACAEVEGAAVAWMLVDLGGMAGEW